MRRLTADQFYKIAGADKSTFKAAVHRQEVALAFGTLGALAGGTFLDLDVISCMLVDELTPAFSRKYAATLMRGFSDVWTEAVARVDATPQPVFLMVAEFGETISGKHRAIREGVNVLFGTLQEISKSKYQPGRSIGPDRMTLVNVTSVLSRARKAAAAIGVDLSAPFCPRIKDAAFKVLRDETRKAREKYVDRVPLVEDRR